MTARTNGARIWRVNRAGVKWGIVVALTIVAIAYFVMPARAGLTCPVNPVELWDARAC